MAWTAASSASFLRRTLIDGPGVRPAPPGPLAGAGAALLATCKLLLDPYAREIVGRFDLAWRAEHPAASEMGRCPDGLPDQLDLPVTTPPMRSKARRR